LEIPGHVFLISVIAVFSAKMFAFVSILYVS